MATFACLHGSCLLASSLDHSRYRHGWGLCMAVVPYFKAGLDDVLQGHCLAIRASLARQGRLPACRHSLGFEKINRVWKTTTIHLVYQDLSTLSGTPLGSRPEHTLGRLLELSNAAECTDDRDKVYALMGLFPTEVSRRLLPDYEEATSRVFIQVA